MEALIQFGGFGAVGVIHAQQISPQELLNSDIQAKACLVAIIEGIVHNQLEMTIELSKLKKKRLRQARQA